MHGIGGTPEKGIKEFGKIYNFHQSGKGQKQKAFDFSSHILEIRVGGQMHVVVTDLFIV
jgi:hypothetical protein